jgi:Uncharacterized protein encoded in hypervariable junctions of pilus gene clusters
MNKSEFELRLSRIQEVEADDLDLELIESAESDTSTISFEQLKEDIEYSGKISLRVPKSLHKELVERAKCEGVSLNQYALFKLSKV